MSFDITPYYGGIMIVSVGIYPKVGARKIYISIAAFD